MKVNVYVDGFNLYYASVKGTAYKWLDISALCRLMLPGEQINRIRYFTAKVRAMPADPQQPQRQQTYLRALRTIPNLEIHYGTFSTWPALRPLVKPPTRGSALALVMDTKEKGSDVNLASYLLSAVSAPAFSRIPKVARTTSDLEGVEQIRTHHLAEVLHMGRGGRRALEHEGREGESPWIPATGPDRTRAMQLYNASRLGASPR